MSTIIRQALLVARMRASIPEAQQRLDARGLGVSVRRKIPVSGIPDQFVVFNYVRSPLGVHIVPRVFERTDAGWKDGYNDCSENKVQAEWQNYRRYISQLTASGDYPCNYPAWLYPEAIDEELEWIKYQNRPDVIARGGFR